MNLEILRFVRDTDACDHMEAALERAFGAATLNAALDAGFLAAQIWGADVTAFIDLTQAGEAALIQQQVGA